MVTALVSIKGTVTGDDTMLNFEYYAPTRIVFGKDSIACLSTLIPPAARVLWLYGGGSIRRNGVYDQVQAALANHASVEFAGVEPNPEYETCLKAVQTARDHQLDFVLAVGGGSVLDAGKFIAAATPWTGDPWDIFRDRGASVASALPLGTVLTLPATGSEMNRNAVISRRATLDKVAFVSPHVLPLFSILDPCVTFTLSPRQIANGVTDAFVHVLEQYVVDRSEAAPLQDRQAEAVLLTLIEEGPKTLARPREYEARANVMWAATQALNGLLSCGVPGDWSTHMIGHELTALYGLDHAQSLAIVLPGVWRHRRQDKAARLLHYGKRVWRLTEGEPEQRVEAAITRTEKFFRDLGLGTTLGDYDLPSDAPQQVARNQARRKKRLGEYGGIGPREIEEILESRR
jgi:NADP-dependent alcohol dehydrogenase